MKPIDFIGIAATTVVLGTFAFVIIEAIVKSVRRTRDPYSSRSPDAYEPPDLSEAVQAMINVMPFRVEYDHYRECWFIMDKHDPVAHVWVFVMANATFEEWQDRFCTAAESCRLQKRPLGVYHAPEI